MAITLVEMARLVGGRLQGSGETLLVGAATIEVAQPGELTLADHPDRAAALAKSPAAAAIVSPMVAVADKPTIVVDDVHAAFAVAIEHFRPSRIRRRLGISPAAFVCPTARVAADVDIHPGAFVGDDVSIGPGSTIHSGARLLAGCVIGAGVTIFPNAVLYEETRVGDRVIIHAGAVLGAYGFGYRQRDGRHVLSAQLGYVDVGAEVEIGAGTTIDRGTYGPTLVGEGTKIDNQVMIGHNCRLGKHNLICSQVGIAGSTSTGDYVVMAGQVGVRDHVHIGSRAVVGSKAGVSNDVPEGAEYLGCPATPIRRQKLQFAAVSKLPEMRRDFRALQSELEELQRRLGLSGSEQSPPADQAA
ncbi:MAG: UDP-3-O-(3-hydroxymyristoyl)glucosamine N-acyltransferase [Pirellulales bacterium]|nr:UDP-3-O-(3-hydroxymyristoyl)glucosamine N-acyltransferase [Pirellulales bacterium]